MCVRVRAEDCLKSRRGVKLTHSLTHSSVRPFHSYVYVPSVIFFLANLPSFPRRAPYTILTQPCYAKSNASSQPFNGSDVINYFHTTLSCSVVSPRREPRERPSARIVLYKMYCYNSITGRVVLTTESSIPDALWG